LSLPLIVELECKEDDQVGALVAALGSLKEILRITEPRYRGTWGSGKLDSVQFGDIKHVMLQLKPIPELDTTEE
jgi:hypothetical protein